ncbi:hypothetical protein GF420_15650 [candidate division GN15 bacterium]|nr:hypothetical protein [candidate division GN15 bacterium]
MSYIKHTPATGPIKPQFRQPENEAMKQTSLSSHESDTENGANMNLQERIERIRGVYHHPKGTKQWFFRWASFQTGQHEDLDNILKDFEPRVFFNLHTWKLTIAPVLSLPEIDTTVSFIHIEDNELMGCIRPREEKNTAVIFFWKPGVYAQLRPSEVRDEEWVQPILKKLDTLTDNQFSFDLMVDKIPMEKRPQFPW